MSSRLAALESDLILDALITGWQKDWDESKHPREPAGSPEEKEKSEATIPREQTRQNTGEQP